MMRQMAEKCYVMVSSAPKTSPITGHVDKKMGKNSH